MRAHQADFPVLTMCRMCRVLKVSPSGYYAWVKRPPSGRARADAVLKARVEQIHQHSRGTYGAPRIRAELAEEGRGVSRKLHRPIDARARSARGMRPPSHLHHPSQPAGTGRLRPGQVGVFGLRPEPPVGCRSHLHFHGIGVFVSERGPGRLESASGGLGHGEPYAYAAGIGRP